MDDKKKKQRLMTDDGKGSRVIAALTLTEDCAECHD
jgi:hypothetical protein